MLGGAAKGFEPVERDNGAESGSEGKYAAADNDVSGRAVGAAPVPSPSGF